MQRMGVGKTYISIIKAISDKPTANILNGEKVKAFPPWLATRQRCPHSQLFNTVWNSSHNIRIKRNKGTPIWKRKIKTVAVCRWYDFYTWKIQRWHQKLLDLINEFDKIAKCKLIYRNLLHFYTPKVKYQKGKLRKWSKTITSKKIKYLGIVRIILVINLHKEGKNLYCKNYKILMKEIEDHTNKWKVTLCSW